MKYITTRSHDTRYSFEEALFMGYAPDGGLIMPEVVPELSNEDINAWSTLSFTQIAKEILDIFVDSEEIPDADRLELLHEAFKTFDCEEVIPVVSLNKDLKIAELFHGQTRAFKDIGLSVAGQLMNYFLKKSGKKAIVLVGTSGDTGSAAIYAVQGLRRLDLIVLYPEGRITEPQERQLVTSKEKNIHVYAVEGTSDDLDTPIKECFCDTEFVNRHSLCSINSINWVRILLQMVPYIYSYFKACSEIGAPVYFLVPTGAAGSITAATLVRKMGFPISIVPCVNSNDIMHKTIQEGIYKMNDSVFKTYASAMDIQVPYNIERLLYLGCNANPQLVKSIMEVMEDGRTVVVPKNVYEEIRKVLIDSCSVTDSEILQSVRRCWNENKYILCPHTATAVTYYYKILNSGVEPRCVCMATASPSKFPQLLKDVGLPPVSDPPLDSLQYMPKYYQHMKKKDDWLQILKEKVEQISNTTIKV